MIFSTKKGDTMFKFLLRRLIEPSTWAGLGTIVTVLGFPLAAPLLIKAGVLVAATAAIVLPEGAIAN